MGTPGEGDPEATTVANAGEDVEAPLDAGDRYVIEEEIGRGGLGRVLRARDRKLERTIAIKHLLKSSPDLDERFRREALLAARLEHPAIVTVHDLAVGQAQPFYTMRHVSGKTLRELIQRADTLRARLELLPQVIATADAVAYAHSEGILHRDIKPANILVGPFGETVVIDWGLAKRVDAPEPAASEPSSESSAELTQVGDVVGTPAYMSPEQAEGRSVDSRTDVYALGALLYEVVTGSPPFASRRLPSDIAREPEEPPVPVLRRAPEAPAELATIIGKAMATAPGDRYEGATQLAQDLKRFTAGQIVSAHHYAPSLLLRRWLRRHRLPVAIAGAAVMAIAVLSVVGVARIVEARDAATARANDLRVAQARAAIVADPTAALAWLAGAAYDAPRFEEARVLALEATTAGVASEILARRGSPTLWLGVSDGGDKILVDGDGAATLWDVPARQSSRIPCGTAVGVLSLSASGDRIACVVEDMVTVFDAAGATVGPRPTPVELVTDLVFAPSGDRLAIGTAEGDVSVLAPDGTIRRLHRHDGGVRSVAWSRAAPLLASSGLAGRVLIWDERTDRSTLLHDAQGGEALVAFAGPRVVVAERKGTLAVGDTSPLGFRATPSPHDILALAVDGRGVLAVTSGTEGDVWGWDLVDVTRPPRRMTTHGARVLAVAVAPDGAWVASADMSGEVRLVSTSGAVPEEHHFRGHRTPVIGFAFLPGGQEVASVARDGEIRRWRLERRGMTRSFDGGGTIAQLAFVRGGRALASVTRAGEARLFDTVAGGVAPLGTVGGEALLAASPDGAWIAAGGSSSLVLVPVAGGPPRALAGHDQILSSLVFSSDGRTLASTSDDGRVFLWKVADGSRREVPYGAIGLHSAFSPDGRRIAVAGTADEVRIWAVDRLEDPPVRLRGHRGAVVRLAWPTPRLLFSMGVDRTVRTWDPDAETQARHVLAHPTYLVDMVVRTDGGAVAVLGLQGMLVHWRVGAGAPVRVPLVGHEGDVYAAVYSPDGRRLMSASADGTVRVWELDGGPTRVLRGHRGVVRRLALAPDGLTLASGGEDGAIRLWPVADPDAPRTPEALVPWIRGRTSAVIGDDGRLR